MSFVTDDKKVYEKYDEIWNVVKSLLKLQFTASPIRDDKYILAKSKILKKKNLATFNNNNNNNNNNDNNNNNNNIVSMEKIITFVFLQ